MDTFLTLPASERSELCEEAGDRLGLDPRSVEKDFWVCWVLRELFGLAGIGPHLTFKGGTSLSKAWKLIERFSEDIDVVIDRDLLGFRGERAPEVAPSNTQRAKRLEELQVACRAFVHERLQPALEERLRARLPAGLAWTLTPDADDDEQQILIFGYPSAFPLGRYLRPTVKIEPGARSDTEPAHTPEIRPYLAEVLPDEVPGSGFVLRTLAPERTFWEKAMLLHEETYRAGSEAPKARLARHYYDLWCLIRAGVGERALRDGELFERVAAHRSVFFRRRREAQESLRPGSLRLLPADDQRHAWAKDYEAMRESMFFGKTPDFPEILSVVAEFERRFNERA